MKVLLAIDCSPASRQILEHVMSRPWPKDASMEIVSVVEPTHLWTNSAVAREAAQRADDIVQNAVLQLQSTGLTVHGITLFGHARSAIVEHANRSNCDWIVLGSHGASGLERFRLGSVATAVLHSAPCSVEIVRPGAIQKVLLATDGSEFSDEAARSIAARPWPKNTEFRVLNEVELILPTSYALFAPPNLETAFLEDQRADAMKRSQEAIANAHTILETAGLTASESISVLIEPPRTIILNEAKDWGANLIVLGSHGHHALDRLILGSVSESVAMHANCSVEVIRAR